MALSPCLSSEAPSKHASCNRAIVQSPVSRSLQRSIVTFAKKARSSPLTVEGTASGVEVWQELVSLNRSMELCVQIHMTRLTMLTSSESSEKLTCHSCFSIEHCTSRFVALSSHDNVSSVRAIISCSHHLSTTRPAHRTRVRSQMRVCQM